MTTLARHLVVLAAGGTGGHMFPAEALATELIERNCRVALITDRRGGSFNGLANAIETHNIMAAGIAGKSLLRRIVAVPELAMGTLQARNLLKRLAPQAVIGFGGYASVPTMLAASFGGLPTAIHEQNSVLGRANRLLASRVERVGVSFKTSRGLVADADKKVIHTGMPVRSAIVRMRDNPYPDINSDGPIRLLVLGGSQGAHIFSEVLPHAISLISDAIRSRLHICQQCRPEDIDEARKAYQRIGMEVELSTFFDDVPERLAASHLIIARAGASTIAEITSVGRPSILVPYPHAIDDHQSINAYSVDEVGGGWLIPEASFNANSLAARLESLFDLPAILQNAALCAFNAGRPDAAARLADMVFDLLPSNGKPDISSDTREKAA